MIDHPFRHALSAVTDHVSQSQHLYAELPNFTLEGYIVDHETLFVTFEPAGVAQVHKSRMRPGWGENILRKLGVSCLCVKANKSNWYLQPDLPEALTALRPFFDSFKRIVTYGGSMGGFGALAYADLIGADTVVSINPQSTLDRRVVPWEDRYPAAQERLLDFSHPLSDAVGKSAAARQVFILSDRWYDYDNKHVQRLMAPNVTYINTPFVEHQVPEHLARMGALSYLVRAIRADNFDPVVFYRLLRKRRSLKRYFNTLEHKVSNHPRRAEIVARHRALSSLLGSD